MKTELVFVGKTSDKRFEAAIDDYVKRVEHYMPVKLTVIPALKNTKNLSEEQQKVAEGDLILKQVQPGDTLVLCDERGKEMRSVEFAQWLEALQQRARKLVSLSRMTFSHQMVRLVLAEQVYRACTIIKGEPYHHE